MVDLAIEALTRANVEDLIHLLADVDPSHFPHASREAALGFLEQDADIFVLGRAGGAAVAFGMLRGWQEGFDTPSLGIAVPRGHERRGYGRAMMSALAGLARDRGARKIRLRVHPDNVRARRLYAACGYREIGLERGEVLMVLEVQPN